jgi:hypothetical protein
VPPSQCCCDEDGFRVLAAGDSCAGSTFPVPSVPGISFVFEWCGLVAERFTTGGVESWYAEELFAGDSICDTTGVFGGAAYTYPGGEFVPSYVGLNKKYLSVANYGTPAGSNCGFSRAFIISGGTIGVQFTLGGDGQYYGRYYIDNSEIYGCDVSQCYDGTEAVVTITLLENTAYDGCGGEGNYEPCNFVTPEVTVLIAT